MKGEGARNRLMHSGLIDRVWSLGLSNLSCSDRIGGRWGFLKYFFICIPQYYIIYTYNNNNATAAFDAPTHNGDDVGDHDNNDKYEEETGNRGRRRRRRRQVKTVVDR